MIRISARLGDGRLTLEMDGHEEHAQEGRVCAAVSAVIQTALLGLEHIAEMHPDLVSIEITQENQ